MDAPYRRGGVPGRDPNHSAERFSTSGTGCADRADRHVACRRRPRHRVLLRPTLNVTLAHLWESDPDFDLGLLVGPDYEWIGGWGDSSQTSRLCSARTGSSDPRGSGTPAPHCRAPRRRITRIPPIGMAVRSCAHVPGPGIGHREGAALGVSAGEHRPHLVRSQADRPHPGDRIREQGSGIGAVPHHGRRFPRVVRSQPGIKQPRDGDQLAGRQRQGMGGGDQLGPVGVGLRLCASEHERSMPRPSRHRIWSEGDADLPHPGAAFSLGASPASAPAI
jgi:hypothetical protein